MSLLLWVVCTRSRNLPEYFCSKTEFDFQFSPHAPECPQQKNSGAAMIC